MTTTTDLSDFGQRELEIAGRLLITLNTVNDDTNYLGDGVKIMMNQSSGNVFLTDEDFNVAMMNGHQLEDWFVSPYDGLEGFYSELKEQYNDMGEEDQEWFDGLEL